MNSITIFKKVQIFSLLLVNVCALSAMDENYSGKDLADMQKESEGTGHILFEKVSSAWSSFSLDDVKESLQGAGGKAVEWANAKFEKAGDKIQKIQESDFVTSAGKTLKEGYTSVKDRFKKAVNKVQSIDLTEAKKTVKDTVKSNVDSAKSVAKGSMKSFKDWFNLRTEYSSEELVIFGGTVLAVVTIAGISYVLYKNGTIKKCGNVVSKYPALTTLSAATAGLLLTAVYFIATRQTSPTILASK